VAEAEVTFQIQHQDQHKTAADREVLEQVQVILELMVKAAVAAEWVKMALLQMVLAVQVL
jgi:hypothetical protein|tara:strand:+ start:259 stop:438 length:180 start_codon:yes stop_codon:yes gene_type:complete